MKTTHYITNYDFTGRPLVKGGSIVVQQAQNNSHHQQQQEQHYLQLSGNSGTNQNLPVVDYHGDNDVSVVPKEIYGDLHHSTGSIKTNGGNHHHGSSRHLGESTGHGVVDYGLPNYSVAGDSVGLIKTEKSVSGGLDGDTKPIIELSNLATETPLSSNDNVDGTVYQGHSNNSNGGNSCNQTTYVKYENKFKYEPVISGDCGSGHLDLSTTSNRDCQVIRNTNKQYTSTGSTTSNTAIVVKSSSKRKREIGKFYVVSKYY